MNSKNCECSSIRNELTDVPLLSSSSSSSPEDITSSSDLNVDLFEKQLRNLKMVCTHDDNCTIHNSNNDQTTTLTINNNCSCRNQINKSSSTTSSPSQSKSNSLQRFIDSVTWRKKSNQNATVEGNITTITGKNNGGDDGDCSNITKSENGKEIDSSQSVSKIIESPSEPVPICKSNSSTKRFHFRTPKKFSEMKFQTKNNDESKQNSETTAVDTKNRKTIRNHLSSYWNMIFKKSSKDNKNSTENEHQTPSMLTMNQAVNIFASNSDDNDDDENSVSYEMIDLTSTGGVSGLKEQNITQNTTIID